MSSNIDIKIDKMLSSIIDRAGSIVWQFTIDGDHEKANTNHNIFSLDTFWLNNISKKKVNTKKPTMYQAPNIVVPCPVDP